MQAQPRDYPHKPGQVYLFGTCLVDLFVPEAGLDAIRLLEREGLTVRYPQAQSCCGQPAYTSGSPEAAREVARAQIGLFPPPWPVVVASGSCAGMIRHHWPRLFADDPVLGPQARELAARTFEFAEFLVEVLDVRFPARAGASERVALHTSCSARREMGTREHGLALLARLPDVEVVEQERESECCGFGGSFSLRHADISGAMVADKCERIGATGCTRFVTADCGCMLNIAGAAAKRGAPLAGEHLASFVWKRTQEGTA